MSCITCEYNNIMFCIIPQHNTILFLVLPVSITIACPLLPLSIKKLFPVLYPSIAISPQHNTILFLVLPVSIIMELCQIVTAYDKIACRTQNRVNRKCLVCGKIQNFSISNTSVSSVRKNRLIKSEEWILLVLSNCNDLQKQ